MYFVLEASNCNPGLYDMEVRRWCDRVEPWCENKMFAIAEQYLKTMLCSRLMVLGEQCVRVAGRKSSQSEWMLIQLHPLHCLGSDVFAQLTQMLVLESEHSKVGESFGAQSQAFEPFYRYENDNRFCRRIVTMSYPQSLGQQLIR